MSPFVLCLSLLSESKVVSAINRSSDKYSQCQFRQVLLHVKGSQIGVIPSLQTEVSSYKKFSQKRKKP